MTWEGLLEKLEGRGLNLREEIYMENYGKVLSVRQSEFQNRQFRCTYGLLHVEGSRIEVLLFPSELHCSEFLEIAGQSPWRVAAGNVLLAFDNAESETVKAVLAALEA